jgi:hypothetical protein
LFVCCLFHNSKLEVVLTFDDNPRKVGVRFDKPILGGTNLGGLCEDQHGFFVDSVDLKHENDLEEGIEGLIVYAAIHRILDEILSTHYTTSKNFLKLFD